MINICTVMMVVTSDDSPKPLLHQIFLKIMTLTIDNNWEEYMITCGGLISNVHLLLLSYIDRIWVCFAMFALNFNNVNVVTENRPFEDLNLSETVAVFLALVEELKRAQAQGVPLIVPRQLVARFTASGGTPSHRSAGS